MYSSPVQNTSSFMVPGASAGSPQGRRQRLQPEMRSDVRVQWEAGAAGLRPQHPRALPSQPVLATAVWLRCEQGSPSWLSCPCPCPALSLIITL